MQLPPTRLVVGILVAMLGLAACDRTNQETSLFRKVSDLKATLVTDAKQRVVVNFKKGSDGRIICAEPSPDVTQAFSEALKVAVNFHKSASASSDNGRTGNLDSSFANSFASSVSQLGERLAVIQLFRDRMYRACEAYANGAIDQTAYTLMLARGDKTMTTLLTAEMAAGSFGRSLAQLGGAARTVPSSSSSEERAKLQEKVSQLTVKLSAIAKSNEPDRVQMATETSQELTEAHTALLALDLSATHAMASSGTAAIALGEVSNENTGAAAAVLAGGPTSIHRTFLDDPGLEPLTDACLTTLTGIELDPDGAKTVATAQGKIKSAAMEIAELDNNTIEFLETILEEADFNENGIAKNLSEREKEVLESLGVKKNGDGECTRSAIEDLLRLSRMSKSQQEDIIRNAEADIGAVMLSQGNPFAGFCTTRIFGNLSATGFVRTMLKSRSDLRRISNEVQLKRLAVCEKMLANELSSEQRTAAIAFCSKS